MCGSVTYWNECNFNNARCLNASLTLAWVGTCPGELFFILKIILSSHIGIVKCDERIITTKCLFLSNSCVKIVTIKIPRMFIFNVPTSNVFS